MNGEKPLTRPLVARRYGLSVSTVKRLDKQGLPSHTWGTRCRRYYVSETDPWMHERETGKIAVV